MAVKAREHRRSTRAADLATFVFALLLAIYLPKMLLIWAEVLANSKALRRQAWRARLRATGQTPDSATLAA